MPGFPAIFQLSTLNGTNGFRFDGVAAYSYSGRSVSSAGDVNGDGFADLIIGAYGADPNGSLSGSSYVVFGKASGFAATTNLSTLDGSNGFRLDGVAAGDRSGWSVSSAGDINGDGFDDLIVGAWGADPNGSYSGSSYVVFGQAGGFAASLNLSTLDGSNGFRLDGVAASDRSGWSVSSAGDVNGDGFDDLVIGANGADPNGSYSGSSYVVFGKASGFAASINPSTLDGSNGFRLDGVAANHQSGVSVSGAGDVNGDGFDDVIVGARGANPNGSYSGAAYVVFGQSSGFAANINLSSLDGANGFRLAGVAATDLTGFSVSSAGDVNGDGFADLIVGAYGADPNGTSSGSTYVVFGKASGFAATLNLSTLNGTSGFRLDGAGPADYSGFSVSSAGDFNGDGFDDLIVGAPRADPNGNLSGATYVVFGKASGFAANLNLAWLDGSNGFRLDGVAAGDYSGRSVSSAGDVNGDGFDDLIVAADRADPNGNSSGSSYVVFGQQAQASVTITGTAQGLIHNGGIEGDIIDARDGDDTLMGWEGDDTLLGGGGNDTIEGDAGDDIIDGGSGNDSIKGGGGSDLIRAGSGVDTIIGSLGEDHIDGGTGTDTLDFSAFGSTQPVAIDLASRLVTLSDGDTQSLRSIENVNGGAGADTISGDTQHNVLRGNNGADTLDGRDGNDTLIGGGSKDILTGGAGEDIFRYQAINHSAPGASTRDEIVDFTIDPAVGAGFIDRIDVEAIDARADTGGNQAFVFIGGAAFTDQGQIRATQVGADTVVSFNTKNSLSPDMQIVLRNFTASTLTEADFIL